MTPIPRPPPQPAKSHSKCSSRFAVAEPPPCGSGALIRASPTHPAPPVPTEFSISSFCTVVDVMNFSKLQVLRLDGNEIKRSAMPVDAPLCLRLASLIEI